MKRWVRMLIVAALVLLLWPEFGRYRAEWLLAEANGRIERALRGLDRGPAAEQAILRAQELAHAAAPMLPGDARPPLVESIALILQRKGEQAMRVLEPAIARGERPELTINLGRARGISGDENGAMAAFLRTAWVSPGAITTLPAAMRGPLLDQVKALEAELRAGRLTAPPPL